MGVASLLGSDFRLCPVACLSTVPAVPRGVDRQVMDGLGAGTVRRQQLEPCCRPDAHPGNPGRKPMAP